MDGVYSSLGGKVSPVTLFTVYFALLVWPVPLEGKFENCVIFKPGLNPFQNCYDISHSHFSQLVSLTGFPGSLLYHHHDNDVEGIYCQEYRQ